jgi:hypothetical protein
MKTSFYILIKFIMGLFSKKVESEMPKKNIEKPKEEKKETEEKPKVNKNILNLELNRKWKNNICTIGELFINGKFFCYTLEDRERMEKVYGETAIPKGKYKVIISYSPRFKQLMPLLLNVPNFKGIRIHWGNYATHTEGCILVGSARSEDNLAIWNSKSTYKKLFDLLIKENKTKQVVINISG